MKKRFFVIFILMFFCLRQYAQNIKNEEKLDPALKSLLAEQKQQNKKKSSSAGKVDDIKRVTEKKIECIIYTRNAKALKDRGIVINSTLPTFVTAIVSLEQIKQLSLMETVTYIEAAKNNDPNK